MRPLRYSVNVTLVGCCDHRSMFADENLHRHAVDRFSEAVSRVVRLKKAQALSRQRKCVAT